MTIGVFQISGRQQLLDAKYYQRNNPKAMETMVVLGNMNGGQIAYKTAAKTVGDLLKELNDLTLLTLTDETLRALKLRQQLPDEVYVVTAMKKQNAKEIEERSRVLNARIEDLAAKEKFINDAYVKYGKFQRNLKRNITSKILLNKFAVALSNVQEELKEAADEAMKLEERKKYLDKQDRFWSDVYAAI